MANEGAGLVLAETFALQAKLQQFWERLIWVANAYESGK
jgi:hypothetical protein